MATVTSIGIKDRIAIYWKNQRCIVMAQRKPEDKTTLEQVLRLVEQLTPAEQSTLRQVLEEQEDIRIADERLKHQSKRWSQEELEQGLDLAN
jgi:hypothetical protein